GAKSTILIGKNGVGKTNMITAIKQALSFVFSKKKNCPQYEFIASSDQKVKSFAVTDPRYVTKEHGGDYTYPIAVAAKMRLGEAVVDWELRRQTADRGIDESYVSRSEKFWNAFPDFRNLPVFAYFSDSYPHVVSTKGTKVQGMLDSGNPLPQNVAYYKWDEERNCTDVWKQYYVMNWKNVRYDNEKGQPGYIEAVAQAVREFTKPVSQNEDNPEFEVETLVAEARGKDDVLVVVFRDGRKIPFDLLPQGYHRILSIVFDIAHRSYLLNQHCNPHGVVFIDEIELHLHPSLAQEVMTRLQNTFAHLQFVVSTHSPLVIADYRQDDEHLLYALTGNVSQPSFVSVENLYGMSYVSILQSVMETPERDSFLHNLAGAFRYWRQAGDERRAKQVAEKIGELVGTNSKFYRTLVSDENNR
ncbi:MAG: AAA family ATPase, partial [Bacteroidaceae bacterium]|nr:AAA family ATPase [Bacteroidaceae bacterium]